MFELAWRGGATEARLHRRRPGSEDLPWGTLDLSRYPGAHALEARKIWSNGVFTEYASAAAFSSLTTAMLACGAPVDLVAMSADIVVDELFHVELSARLTMELGGAVPLAFDLANIAPVTTPGARPLVRAAEIAMTTSCVSESLSVPAMARSRALASEPLIRAVLERLLADEGPHARLGFWFFDWANDELTDGERAHLARLAEDTIEAYAPLWQDVPCESCALPAGLGGHDDAGKDALRAAITTSIASPLARYGIVLDDARIAALVA
ncbi:MAG: hypothetical protein H0T89_22510 [Deltaproteobacteria bacterium]|nr:hypothetical protein [Deltaproteobacteria bacterium]MDQ3295215.1 hypothetical protein [Myxococcota bacterium]